MSKTIKNTILTKTALAMAIATAPTAFAEDYQSLQLEEIVVVARKRAESIQDVPVAVSVFDGQTAKDLKISNIQGVVEYTPGATFAANSPGEQRLSIRGVSSGDWSASGGAGVLMMVDEEVIARDFMYSATAFDIARVEVLRGPQGTTYGRNAAGGVVHILSNQPHEETEFFAKANVGNYNLLQSEAMINGALSDNVNGRLAIYSQSQDGFSDDFSTGKSVDDSENHAARATLAIEPSEDLQITLRATWNEDHHDNPAPRKLRNPDEPDFLGAIVIQEPSDDPWTVSNSDNLFYDREVFSFSSTINWELENLDLTSITTYRTGDDDARVDLFGTEQDLVVQNVENDATTWSQEIRLNGELEDSSVRWLAGLYYLHEEHERSEVLEVFTNDPVFDALGLPVEQTFIQENSGDSYGLFGELNYDITDATNLSVGLRYSYDKKDYEVDHSVTFGANILSQIIAASFIADPTNPVIGKVDDSWSSVTGKVSLNHHISNDSMIYLSVGNGTKSGGFNPQPVNLEALQTPYDEEKVLSTELGIKSELFDNRLRLNAVVFNSSYEDIQTQGFLASGATVIENAGEATIQGFEVDFMWVLTEGLSLVGSYANYDAQYDERMLDGVDLSGEKLEEVPSWTGHLGAIYTYSLDDMGTLRLRADYRSRSDVLGLRDANLGELDRPGKDIFNASVGWQSADEKWNLLLWGKNLGDQAEMLVTGPSSLFQQSRVGYGAPRTYGLSVSYHMQ